jgi:hypothetical protein
VLRERHLGQEGEGEGGYALKKAEMT